MRHIKTLVYWKDVPGYEGYYQVKEYENKIKALGEIFP